MAGHHRESILLFRRNADRRLALASFIFDAAQERSRERRPAGWTNLVVENASRAIECQLKALILRAEPASRRPSTFLTFRGAQAHSLPWLVRELARRGVRLDRPIAEDLAELRWWTHDRYYTLKVVAIEDAEACLDRTASILEWARGRT